MKPQTARTMWLVAALLACCLPVAAGAAATWQAQLSSDQLPPGGVALVTIGPLAPTAAVAARDADLALPLWYDTATRQFNGLLAIGLDGQPGSGTVTVSVAEPDPRQVRLPYRIVPHTFPVRRLQLPDRQVHLSPANEERNRRERRQLEAAIASAHPTRQWQGAFQRPLPGRVITPFGYQRIINGEPRSPHTGIDLAATPGDPVNTTAAGTVLLVCDHFFTGKSVYIDHGSGVVSMYFHLSEALVSTGAPVRSGQTIGRAGSTGRSTGPHLHWGVRVHNRRIDPLGLLRLLHDPEF